MQRIITIATAVAAAAVATGSAVGTVGVTGSTSVPPDEAILGPDGYKTLEIGQTGEEAEATGLLVDKLPGDCDFYYLHPDEGEQNVGSGVFVDHDLGVVMIGGTDESETPEGIGMGSAFDDVAAAYPDLAPVSPGHFVFSASVPDHDLIYRFAFDESDEVSDFGLQAEDMGECGSDDGTGGSVPPGSSGPPVSSGPPGSSSPAGSEPSATSATPASS